MHSKDFQTKVEQSKGLVVCYVVWLGLMIYGMGLWASARCVVWSLVMVRMAIELKSHRFIHIQIKQIYPVEIYITKSEAFL